MADEFLEMVVEVRGIVVLDPIEQLRVRQRTVGLTEGLQDIEASFVAQYGKRLVRR
jgi:hypothetical protein